ncbi:MAG: MAPEG family protein [Myxococcota bacterium]
MAGDALTVSAGLLAYVALTLLLVSILVGYRSVLVLQGRPANTFTPSGEDVGPFSQRLCRAYLNCVENLPHAGALMLLSLVSDQAAVVAPLMGVFVGARWCQSLVHLASIHPAAVIVRFTFFVLQIGIEAYWLVMLVRSIFA